MNIRSLLRVSKECLDQYIDITAENVSEMAIGGVRVTQNRAANHDGIVIVIDGSGDDVILAI